MALTIFQGRAVPGCDQKECTHNSNDCALHTVHTCTGREVPSARQAGRVRYLLIRASCVLPGFAC